MWFLTGLVNMVAAVLLGLLKFMGLWVAYGFSWFMFLCVILLAFRRAPETASNTKRGKITIDFWVCLWFGFMTAVVHSIIWALI